MSKLSEIMAKHSPNPAYKALVADAANAYLLAVNLNDATDPDDYIVAYEGVTEMTGSLNPETTETKYLYTGTRTVKTGNQRQFSVSGDRFTGGDAFQDAILAHGIKYGMGNTIVRDYVYFNALTGKGEKGKIAIMVEEDVGGSAGENATWSASLNGQGTPDEYTYVSSTP